jgi:beta-mannosidase
LSGVLSGTSVKLPAKPLSILKTPLYRNFGPDYSLTVEYIIDPKQVELWYPATLGNPTLYDLELTLQVDAQHSASKTQESGELSWSEKVGFRTIVVDQSRYTDQEVSNGIRPGTRFTFVINGKPFYVQGSRYLVLSSPGQSYGNLLTFFFLADSMIPIDNFAARVNSTTIRWLLESALLANQNVVRIWGGGAYQTDEFYDVS